MYADLGASGHQIMYPTDPTCSAWGTSLAHVSAAVFSFHKAEHCQTAAAAKAATRQKVHASSTSCKPSSGIRLAAASTFSRPETVEQNKPLIQPVFAMSTSFGTFEPSDAVLAAMQARVGAARAVDLIRGDDDLMSQRQKEAGQQPAAAPSAPSFKLHGGYRETVPAEHKNLPPAVMRVAETGGVSFGIKEASRQYGPPTSSRDDAEPQGVFTMGSASSSRSRELPQQIGSQRCSFPRQRPSEKDGEAWIFHAGIHREAWIHQSQEFGQKRSVRQHAHAGTDSIKTPLIACVKAFQPSQWQKKWNGTSIIEALKFKLKERGEGCTVMDAEDKELAILQKVVEDGEVAESLQPSERATLHILQHGLRDYIDFALDEVGTPLPLHCPVQNAAVSDCYQRELSSVSHGCACRSRMLRLSRSFARWKCGKKMQLVAFFVLRDGRCSTSLLQVAGKNVVNETTGDQRGCRTCETSCFDLRRDRLECTDPWKQYGLHCDLPHIAKLCPKTCGCCRSCSDPRLDNVLSVLGHAHVLGTSQLGRHARVVSTVTDEEEFAWSRQGDPTYNPCLKCSIVENAVGDDMERTSPPKMFFDQLTRVAEFGEDAWWFTSPAPGGRAFSEAERRSFFEHGPQDRFEAFCLIFASCWIKKYQLQPSNHGMTHRPHRRGLVQDLAAQGQAKESCPLQGQSIGKPSLGQRMRRQADGCLNAGTSVRAYYDMNDHPMGYRYVKMLEMPRDGPADASDPPVVGVSQGWIPATVVEDYDPKQNGGAGVLVKLHGFFEDPYREEKPVSGMMWKVQPNLICLRSSPPVKIQLSLVVVRWKEYYTRTTTSRSHNILNESLIRDLLAGEASCKEVFGDRGAYEVISVFASAGRHLDAVPRELLASSLRGSRKAALFFLWPTLKKGSGEQGHVDADAMKSLMTGLEGLGVKTCWPHPWSLYEDLVSKQWAPRDCSRLELRIPPTTSVSRKSLKQLGVKAVASSAIAELQRLSTERGRTPLSQDRCGAAFTSYTEHEQYRGVAKLTYSWMGVAVLPFVGEESLQRALEKLLDGMPDHAQSVSKEFAANCEWDASFALTSHKTLTKEELVMQKFSGDRKTVDQIEEEVRRTAFTWLEHFKLKGCAPHVIRMDFLVSVPPNKPSTDFEVHICELTECGGATCGLHVCTRTAATLNECMDGHEGADFPKPLPPFRLEIQRTQLRPEPAKASTVSRSRNERSDANVPSMQRVENAPSDRPPRRRLELFAAMLAVALLLWQRKIGTTQLKRLLALPPIGLFAVGAAAVYIAPADLADIDENIEAAVVGDAPGRLPRENPTVLQSEGGRSPKPSSSPKSGGSRRMSQDEQTSMHAAADEALLRAIAQASAGLSMDASCLEENESVQEGLPSVSVSKLPSAVTVAGVPVATTGDLVYLGGGLYAAAAPAEKPAKKQSAAPARPRPRKPPSAIRSASAHIVGNGARADGDSSPQSRAQSEGQIGVGNLNPDGRGSSRHGSVSGSTSVGSAAGVRIWRPSGVQKLPPAKLEPPSGFGGRASWSWQQDMQDCRRCLCFSREDGEACPICGWVVELADDEVIVGTAVTSATSKIPGSVEGVSGAEKLRFVKIPRASATTSQPATWKGNHPHELPSWVTSRACWRAAGARDLESSEADVQPARVEKKASKKGLGQELRDLSHLFGDGGDDSESDEDDEIGQATQAAASNSRVLAPGAPAKGRKVEEPKKTKKPEIDVQTLLADGLAKGQSAARTMVAVVSLNKLHARIKSRPAKIYHEFEREIVEDMGIVAGQAWTIRDYLKKQAWGKFKGIFRCAVMDAAAYEMLRAGETDRV
eukprot:s3090_g1.t4